MLPRSCFLLADSKSNSSTFDPRSTTTRVSSGCDASMSILFAMMDSRHGDRGQDLRQVPLRERRSRPLAACTAEARGVCVRTAVDRRCATYRDALWFVDGLRDLGLWPGRTTPCEVVAGADAQPVTRGEWRRHDSQ